MEGELLAGLRSASGVVKPLKVSRPEIHEDSAP